MLKSLMKAVGIGEQADTAKADTETNAELQTTISLAVTAAVEGLVAEFEAFKETAEAMVAQAGEINSLLAAQLAEATTKLADTENRLSAAYELIGSLSDDAECKRVATRQDKIVAAVGELKAPALLAATDSLDDAAFDAVVSALVGGVAAEAASPLFTEVGVTAEVDASKIVVESKEMQILKKKYPKK